MVEFTYEVADPVLGFVSCESLDHAKDYAAKVGGDVYRAGWENGEEISLDFLLVDTDDTSWICSKRP